MDSPNDYADKYYEIIRAKETKKAMLKTIITIRHENSFNPKLCHSKRTLEVTPSSAINSIR
jgi:hypothetical protein